MQTKEEPVMEYSEKNYTRYMSEMVNKTMAEINSFYCREDVERKRAEVLYEQKKKRSGFSSRKRELVQMCLAYGVDAEILCHPEKEEEAQRLLKQIPTRKGLCKELLAKFHALYRQFPTSVQFFERLVRRQLHGEFAQDSVRLAIVKKFVKETEYETEPLTEWLIGHFSEKEAAVYAGLKEEEQRLFLADRVTEELCDLFLAGTDSLGTTAVTGFMLEQLKKEEQWYPQSSELHERLLLLREEWKNLSESEVEQAQKIFRKEVLAVLGNVEYVTSNGNVSNRKAAFMQAQKDYKKKLRAGVQLFRFADHLANGKFIVSGNTKEMLYIFAIVFGLKVYLSELAPEYKAEDDLVKNLFYDYYNDNLLRYVLDSDYVMQSKNYETEPTGEGINFKNYAEIVYLYYIYREDLGLSIKEKLCRAEETIKKCIDLSRNRKHPVQEAPKEATEVYKRRFMDTVLVMEEEELVAYLAENYYISSEDGNKKRTSYAQEQNTASAYDEELTRWIEEEFHEASWDGESISYEYGIDVEGLYQMLLKNCPEGDRFRKEVLEDADFRRLLDALETRLSSRDRNLFRDGKKKKITRTRLIALYYCYFINVMSEELDGEYLDLPTLLEEFAYGSGERKGVDYYLERCRYQKMSKKNIFDMFVVFALYLEQIR